MNENNRTTMPSTESCFFVCVSTHPGSVRDHNEDNFVVNDVILAEGDPIANLRADDVGEPLICGVFDGMGGEANGDLASLTCAREARQIYRAVSAGTTSFDDAVRAFVTGSNDAVVEMLENARAKRGGSTFVMIVVIDGVVYPYSLGDSRLYWSDGNVLTQITEDHTLAMKKYYANIYTLEEALESSDSHKLTSFIGADHDGGGLMPATYQPFVLKKGEKLLLCSDGLYDLCSDEEILAILRRRSDTVSLDLVNQAIENGGKDNVTCIVIEKR